MTATTAIEYSCPFCHVNVFTWHYPNVGARRPAPSTERRVAAVVVSIGTVLRQPGKPIQMSLGQAVARMSPEPSHEAIDNDVTRI
jgi:hypothetical protein